MKIDDFKIKWRYTVITTPESVTSNVTHCTIEHEATKVVAGGVASCSRKDIYNKEEGRRLALERALLSHKDLFNKDFRQRVWEMYRNLPKTPRW